MNKIALIIRREYLTRIRNKTFILTTILTPLVFVGIIFFSTYMATRNTETLKIAVYDQSGIFLDHLPQSGKNLSYVYVGQGVIDSIKDKNQKTSYSGALIVPSFDVNKPEGITYVSDKQLGVFSMAQMNDDLNDILQTERMKRANIDTARLAEIKRNSIKVAQQIESQTVNSGVSYMIGYGSGMLIYVVMFIYGTMVMRGVMEEKVNRIAEVMVSSVKPFQLMLGKILGIGAVGLTQFLIWIGLLILGITVVSSVMSVDPGAMHAMPAAASGQEAESMMMAQNMKHVLNQVNIPFLIGSFVLYFIGGFLFYAALFAAIGSAVNEDPQDAQSMMLPITAPIIIAMIMMVSAVANPTGSIAVWGSIIPFTSPIIMMGRLPFGVPGTVTYWELILSVVLLIGGFIFTTWFGARIYRTGILMYGKKANWKEMMKWLFKRY